MQGEKGIVGSCTRGLCFKRHVNRIWLNKFAKSLCVFGALYAFLHICPPGFEVGAYLKTPRYPIWLVCSESHFSVLFGLQRELLASQDPSLQFDLYYYDGLANQQEEIRLTVCKCAHSVIMFGL